MKMIIQRNRLGKAVKEVMAAIVNKPSIPILTGIKFTLSDSGLSLMGSDSDVSIESLIPIKENGDVIVEISQTGSIVIPAKLLNEMIQKLSGDTVKMEVGAHLQMTVTSGKAKFNLNGLDADEFPRLPNINGQSTFSVDAIALKKVISQTAFATSTSDTRPILTGINWKLEDSALTCTATDSHRLAYRKISVNANTFDPYNITVPGKSLVELSKILDKGTVDVLISENQVLFKAGHLSYYSRLLDGNYPDTSRLIPTDSKTNLKLNSKELLQVIDRAALVAKEGVNKVVKMAIGDSNMIQITSGAASVGQVSEEIFTESTEGEKLTISFSSKYMLDALKAIEGKDAVIRFAGPMRPFIMYPAEDNTAVQLILPVREAVAK